MNKEMQNEVIAYEKEKIDMVKKDPYRMGYHLMAPVGWINDPNGLCQFHGVYHVFFQYAPYDATGAGIKCWGHYISEDLLNWNYVGAPILPDMKEDRSGAYSGSAFIEDDTIYLFYTGNVKEDGDYDYIHEGRGSNVILVTSKDGIHFSEKEVIMTNADYPDGYTQHIRDPKINKIGDTYYMTLGARMNGDKGAALIYESNDLKDWTFYKEITTTDTYGYMWECPDVVEMSTQEQILIASVQGLERQKLKYQNIYLSGYFTLSDDFRNEPKVGAYTELDMGFDFYAPQVFDDESGRKLLIGWVGLPDVDCEYQIPTVKNGWQHCLTLPRELSYKDGVLYQYPVNEMDELRQELVTLSTTFKNGMFDFVAKDLLEDTFTITICDGLVLSYKDGIFNMKFVNDMGCGRTERNAVIETISEIRILMDVSVVEVYINKGEVVLTTRLFPDTKEVVIATDLPEEKCSIWSMKEMEVTC